MPDASTIADALPRRRRDGKRRQLVPGGSAAAGIRDQRPETRPHARRSIGTTPHAPALLSHQGGARRPPPQFVCGSS